MSTKEPFTSKEVRQALNYAVNKEELSDGLYNGNMVAGRRRAAAGRLGVQPRSASRTPTIPTGRASCWRRPATTRATR